MKWDEPSKPLTSEQFDSAKVDFKEELGIAKKSQYFIDREELPPNMLEIIKGMGEEMSKIDEIKKKLEWSSYHGDISPNEVEGDIEFLLSKLTEVEKTLITLSLHAEARKQRDIGFETVENICDKALQQLRS